MKNIVLKTIKNPFARNLAIVVSGTASAQALNLVFSPIITRLYGPEAYGILGVFLATMAIVSPVAALTYPTAIVLPKSNKDAKVLIYLSMYISGVVSLLLTLLLLLCKDSLVNVLQIQAIAPYIYLIPLVVLFSAFLQVTKQWMIRTKQFAITARVEFLQALFINSSKIGIGFFSPVAAVLVIISTVSSFLQALMLSIGLIFSKNSIKDIANKVSISSIKNMAVNYKDFPLLRSPQVLMNAATSNLPVLLLTGFFGPASAGFYTLSRTVMGVPIRLVSKSIGDVFYPRITEAFNNGKNIKKEIINVTLLLIFLGTIPFGIIIVFGPFIFEFIFGYEWVKAGEYARWLAIWLFLMFINRPSITAIPVLRLQGKFLIYEILSVISKVIALLIGFIYFKNDIISIALFSITGGVAYLLLIFWVIYSSGRYVTIRDEKSSH